MADAVDGSTPDPVVDGFDAPAPGTPASRRHRGLFELEGRAAPGLYLVGWGLAVAGIGTLFIAVTAGSGAGASIAFVVGLALLSVGLAAGAGSQALQRRADGLAYTGPSPVLVFAVTFGLTLVVGFVIGAVGIVPDGSVAVLASVLVSAGVTLGVLALLVVSPGALSWGEMGFRLPRRGEGSAFADVVLGVALAVPTLFGAGLLAAILVGLLGVSPGSPIPETREPLGVLVNLVAAVVVAPLWEETFFRGFVTTAWMRTAGPRAAIVRGAVFFALIHVVTLGGDSFDAAVRAAFIAFVVRLPVGLVLGWIFVRRGTLVAPIALHAAYNAIPVLLVAAGAGATPT